MSECPMSPDVENLTASIKVLAEKIDLMVIQHQTVVRWLLVVVCVIALGRSAIDLGEKFIKNAVAQVETK